LMAELGYRSLDEMIGQIQMIDQRRVLEHWKAKGLDFSNLFLKPDLAKGESLFHNEPQDHAIHKIIDRRLIAEARPALEHGTKVQISSEIHNTDRTAGAMLSGEIAKRYGHEGLPHDTITVNFKGIAGQSFGAWLAR